MSRKYKYGDRIPSEVLCKRLKEISRAVVEGGEAIDREFSMWVPAERDHDVDFVLVEAAKRIKSLESEFEYMRKVKVRLRDMECGKCGRSLAPDGDCHGCRADRLEVKIGNVLDLLDNHDGLMAPGDIKIHLVRKELDRDVEIDDES